MNLSLTVSDLIRSKDDAEYDHRIFSIHQVESRRRDAQTGRNKITTNDTWLHSGGVAPSNVPSRIASPEIPPGMDAGTDLGVRGNGDRQLHLESQGVGSQVPLSTPNIPFLDNIGTHLGGVDMPIVPPTPVSSDPLRSVNGMDSYITNPSINTLGDNGNNGGFWPSTFDNDTRRWMNLDHGFDFQSQSYGNEDTLFQEIDQTAFNDFSRFLEQAGSSNSDTELFPW